MVEAAPKTPKRRRGRRILRVTLVGLALTLLLAFGALQTRFVKDKLSLFVTDLLGEIFEGSFEIGRLDGFLPFSIALEEVRVLDPQGEPVLAVASLDTRVHLWPLLRQEVHLSDLVVQALALHALDDDAQLRLLAALKPRGEAEEGDRPDAEEEGGAGWTVRLDGVRFEGGEIQDLPPEGALRLEDLQVSLTLGVATEGIWWRDLALSLRPTGGGMWQKLADDEAGQATLSVSGDGRFEGARLRLEEMAVHLGQHRLALDGWVDLDDGMESALSLKQLEIALARLPDAWQAQLGREPGAEWGKVQGSGTLRVEAAEAGLTLDMMSPYGLMTLRATVALQEGEARFKEPGPYMVTLDLLDTRMPPALRPEGLDEDEVPRMEARLLVSGEGLVGDEGGRLTVDLELIELSGGGRLEASGRLLEAHPLEGTVPLELSMLADSLPMQPWLSLVGETAMEGELKGVEVQGVAKLSRDGVSASTLAMQATFGVEAEGKILALDKEIRLSELSGNADIVLGGEGGPKVQFGLKGADLNVEMGGLGEVDIQASLEADEAGDAELKVVVGLEELHWEGIAVRRLSLPISLGVEGAVGEKALRLRRGTVSWQADGVRAPGVRVARLAGETRLSDDGAAHRLVGRVVADQVDARGLGVGQVGQVVWRPDLRIGKGRGGDVAGGALTGSMALDVRRAEVAGVAVERVSVDELWVSAPQALKGPYALDGEVAVASVVHPDGEVAAMRAGLDVLWDPAKVWPLGAVRLRGQRAVALGHYEVAAFFADLALEEDGVGWQLGLEELGVRVGSAQRFEFKGEGQLRYPTRGRGMELEVTRVVLGDEAGQAEGAGERGEVGAQLLGLSWVGEVLRAEEAQLRLPGGGQVVVSGAYAFKQALWDATLVAEGVDVGAALAWIKAESGWLGPETTLALPEEVAARVDLKARVGGGLAAPTVEAELAATGVRWGELEALSAVAELGVGPEVLWVDAGMQWQGEGELTLAARLPGALSLAPVGWVWQEGEALAVTLDMQVPSVAALMAPWQGVEALAWHVEGAVVGEVRVHGTVDAPRLRADVQAEGVEIQDWRGKALQLEAVAEEDQTAGRVELLGEAGETVLRVDLGLPFALLDALSEDDPLGWMRARAQEASSRLTVLLPEREIAALPLAELFPLGVQDALVRVDFNAVGPWQKPIVFGELALEPPPQLRELGYHVQLKSQEEDLFVTMRAQQPERSPLLEGEVVVPQLGHYLLHLDSVSALAKDPGLKVRLQTADLAPNELWPISQSVAEQLSMFFPDGRMMLDIDARGRPEGPEATLVGRIRTVIPAGHASPATMPVGSPRRNLAEDLRLGVFVDEQGVKGHLVLLQDTPKLPPYLSMQVAMETPLAEVLEGRVEVGEIPVEGRLVASEFRLEGLAAGFRDLLGSTGGHLSGDLGISGTLLAPRFERSLSAQFEPITVAPLGLEQPWMTVNLDFHEGTEWTLSMSEFLAAGEREAPGSRCGYEVPAGAGEAERAYWVMGFSGSIPRLDPKVMTVEGCVGLEDFPILSRSDMVARSDGELRVGGTIAKPEIRGEVTVLEADLQPSLGSKSVRPIGVPMDVTLVRGRPEPPAVREVQREYEVPFVLDIRVAIPKDKMRLESSLTQAFGEVRALLYPYGDLHIYTQGGELAIQGRVEVPKERVVLYGRDFIVDPESHLVFTGDMSRDPQLSFVARYNIEHVDLSSIGLQTNKESEIVVRVSGTPAGPQLEFSSVPAMDDANILSVITLGIPAGGEADVGDAVSGHLVTAIMGMATMQFARDFQQRLALDVLKIESRTGDPLESQVTVGKRLTDKLILSYYLNLAAKENEDTNAGSLEYRITPYLSLLGRAGDLGKVGVELHLRFQD